MNTSTRTTFLLFFFSLLFITQLAAAETNDDKKTTIQIGKKLSTLDDIRLGDFTIKADDPVASTAAEELHILLTTLLKFQKQDVSQDIQLKDLITNAVSTIPSLQKNQSNGDILWNAENQKALDEQIEQHYAELQKMALPKETHALISLVHTQYLFTNKKNSEGLSVLQSIIQEYSGTPYEVRARGERVFRLFLAKRYTESKKEAGYILEHFPDTREGQDALYFRARSDFQLGDYEQSVRYFDQFTKQQIHSKWLEGAKYFGAKGKHLLKRYEESINEFKDFITDYPNSIYRDVARELIATAYINQKKLDKAIESYEQYKKENSSVLEFIAAEKRISLYASTQATVSKYSKRDSEYKYYDSIVKAFPGKMDSLLKLFPNDNAISAQSNFALYNYYANEGDNLTKAISILEKIYNTPSYLTMNPLKENDAKNCTSCGNRGLLYKPWILQRLMILYVQNGEFSKVTNYKNELLKSNNLTNYYELELKEIEITYKQKKQTNAKYYEERLLPISNNVKLIQSLRAQALFVLADILAHENNKTKAIELYTKIANEFPTSPYSSTSKTLAKIYLNKGN